MLSALCAVARLSVTWVYHTKTVKDRITKFSAHGSLIPLVLWGKFQEILMGPPPRARAPYKGGLVKISHFLALSVNISKTVPDMAKVTIND